MHLVSLGHGGPYPEKCSNEPCGVSCLLGRVAGTSISQKVKCLETASVDYVSLRRRLEGLRVPCARLDAGTRNPSISFLRHKVLLFVHVKELQRQRTRLMSNLEAQKNFNLMVTLAVTGNDLSTHYKRSEEKCGSFPSLTEVEVGDNGEGN